MDISVKNILLTAPRLIKKLKLAIEMNECFIPYSKELYSHSLAEQQIGVKWLGIKNVYFIGKKASKNYVFICLAPYYSDYYRRGKDRWFRKTKGQLPSILAFSDADILFDQITMDQNSPAFY